LRVAAGLRDSAAASGSLSSPKLALQPSNVQNCFPTFGQEDLTGFRYCILRELEDLAVALVPILAPVRQAPVGPGIKRRQIDDEKSKPELLCAVTHVEAGDTTEPVRGRCNHGDHRKKWMFAVDLNAPDPRLRRKASTKTTPDFSRQRPTGAINLLKDRAGTT